MDRVVLAKTSGEDLQASNSLGSNEDVIPSATTTTTTKKSLFTLEPAVLLLFIAYSWSSTSTPRNMRYYKYSCYQICTYYQRTIGTILQNQIIYQSCTVRFGFNASDCQLLGTPDASKVLT